MRKILVLVALATISVSAAAPAMGTKQDVTKGAFCKEYKCKYVKKEADFDDTRTLYQASFYGGANIALIVKTDSSKKIKQAQIIFAKGFIDDDNQLIQLMTSKIVNAFFSDFAGKSLTDEDYKQCVQMNSDEAKQLLAGKIDSSIGQASCMSSSTNQGNIIKFSLVK